MSPIEREIEALKGLDLNALRAAWRARLSEEPPPLRSGDLFRRFLAERIQQDAFGRDFILEREIARLVRAAGARCVASARGAPGARATGAGARQSGGSAEADATKSGARRTVQPRLLAPGAVLVREWQGQAHHVEVLADGFRWKGERYASLSVIARAITGARWNGPRFFGLREKAAA